MKRKTSTTARSLEHDHVITTLFIQKVDSLSFIARIFFPLKICYLLIDTFKINNNDMFQDKPFLFNYDKYHTHKYHFLQGMSHYTCLSSFKVQDP